MRMVLLVGWVWLNTAALVRAEDPQLNLRLRLSEQRLETVRSRETAGFWLLGFGAASALGGGLLAGVGHDNHALLAAGITTASFGLVNALLSFGLMDLSETQSRRILCERTHGVFATQREEEIVSHLHSGQFFAVNTGLDVFYIAAGALLCVIAAVRNQPDRWELGAGSALIGQGVFLLGFDVYNWAASNGRAAAARAL